MFTRKPQGKSGNEDELFREFIDTLKKAEEDRNKQVIASSRPTSYVVRRDALNAAVSYWRNEASVDVRDILSTADEFADWLIKAERIN